MDSGVSIIFEAVGLTINRKKGGVRMKPVKLINLLLSLAIMVTMLTSSAQAALKAVGPNDPVTTLPVISDSKCLACGACVKACPRNLIELRKRAKKDRKLYVACSSCDKGAIAKKACRVACIGCNKCLQVCAFNSIRIENWLAYIDADKCTFCRKCVAECPTGSIVEINFPARKAGVEKESEKQEVRMN